MMYPRPGRTKPRHPCCARLVASRQPDHPILRLVRVRQASRSNLNPYSEHRFEAPYCAKAATRYPKQELLKAQFLPGRQTRRGATASDLQTVAFQFWQAELQKRAPWSGMERPVLPLPPPSDPEPNSTHNLGRTTTSRRKVTGLARPTGAA